MVDDFMWSLVGFSGWAWCRVDIYIYIPLGAKKQDMLVVCLFDLILGHVDWNKQMLNRSCIRRRREKENTRAPQYHSAVLRGDMGSVKIHISHHSTLS